MHIQDAEPLRRMTQRSAGAELMSLDPFCVPGGLLANFSVGDVYVVMEFAMVDESLELVRVDIRGYAAGDSAESAIVGYKDLELPLRRMRDAALREHRLIAARLLEESEDDVPGDSGEPSHARQLLDTATQHLDGATRARTAAEVKAPISRALCEEVADLYREILSETRHPPVRAINAEIARRLDLPLSRVNRVIYKARHTYDLLPSTERGIPRA